METLKIKTVEQTLNEKWNAPGYDLDFEDAVKILKEDRAALHTSLVAAVEGKRIKDLPSSVQDPGGFCRGLGYNRSLDDTLTIINSIFKE